MVVWVSDLFGSNYNMSIFILATESMGQMKWQTVSIVATNEFFQFLLIWTDLS